MKGHSGILANEIWETATRLWLWTSKNYENRKRPVCRENCAYIPFPLTKSITFWHKFSRTGAVYLIFSSLNFKKRAPGTLLCRWCSLWQSLSLQLGLPPKRFHPGCFLSMSIELRVRCRERYLFNINININITFLTWYLAGYVTWSRGQINSSRSSNRDWPGFESDREEGVTPP